MTESLEDLLQACTYNNKRKKIGALDIGIINLGFVTCWAEQNMIDTVEVCELTDIKDLCQNCCSSCCKLSHEASVIDWVAHFVAKFQEELDSCDVILIEKQPPGGIQHVETLLIKEFRSKVVTVYPMSLHKFMDVVGVDYDGRKEKMERMARGYLKSFRAWNENDRKHDMADALCFILYYLGTLEIPQAVPIYSSIVEPIENFRFKSVL